MNLRDQDSVCVFAAGCFGAILPEVGVSIAQQIYARVSEGQTNATGARNRFTFKINASIDPEQASSAHDFELGVSGLFPEFSLASGTSIGNSVSLA